MCVDDRVKKHLGGLFEDLHGWTPRVAELAAWARWMSRHDGGKLDEDVQRIMGEAPRQEPQGA